MTSKISLNAMRFYAYHGVLPQEKKVGNWFSVDLELSVDLSRAALSDQLQDTLNYAEVYAAVEEEMAIPSELLEHAAGRILRRIRGQFPQVEGIMVRLTKEYPPSKGKWEGLASPSPTACSCSVALLLFFLPCVTSWMKSGVF